MKKIIVAILKPRESTAKVFIFIALVAFLALGFSGHLQLAKDYLDTPQLTFMAGNFKLSVYGALKAIIVVVLIFWISSIVVSFSEKRLASFKKIRPSNRTLIHKILQIVIYMIAFLLALNVIGLDLTALTVFSGALGIGLGFGLQKIASNFISGLILLLEKSVEQDDLIELVDGTFGFVRKSGARYTLVETMDSKEILVPNEDFITCRVINWTFSNKKGRVEIPVGVSYGSNIEKARDLILEAAHEHPLCIKNPEPRCYLRNFSDSSVDFILHFWLGDITGGRWMPQSEVMFSIWNKFKENDIEIPFPQRDVHIKEGGT